jgi:hypothetical protein
MSKSFLWINKDPSSKSLSNNRTGPLPYSQINKHVQRQTARRKLKRKVVESSATNLVGWQTQDPSPPPLLSLSSSDTTSSPEEAKFEEDENNGIASSTSSSPPTNAVDSYSNSLVKLSSSEQNAIQYFLKVWMPADDYIPPDCQIAGFTPVWPNDGKAANEIIRGALQTDDAVSIYALLVAATRRAQTLNKVQLGKSRLPEEFSLKAVQALRRRIELRLPSSQRLILDLSYLVLAELYSRSPARSVIFWKMTRDLIVGAGGLHKLEPFTGLAALAYDYFIAMGTITLPALNVFRDPALLDVDATLNVAELYQAIQTKQTELETRVRTVTYENNEFSLVIDAIRLLPEPAQLEITSLVQSNVPKLYPLIAAPFQRSPDWKPGAEDANDVMSADALSIHVRHSVYRIWLWHTAFQLGHARAPDEMLRLEAQPPQSVYEDVSRISEWLDHMTRMLTGSGWHLNLGVTFWMCAVCFLVSVQEDDQQHLTKKLIRLAVDLDLASKPALTDLLSMHLPLDRLHTDPTLRLWDVIVGIGRNQDADEI